MKRINIIGPTDKQIKDMQDENNSIKKAMEAFLKIHKMQWHEAWDIVIEKGTRKVKDQYKI